MKMFVGTAMVAMVAGLMAGCLDNEQTVTQPDDQGESAAAQVSTMTRDQLESLAPETSDIGISAHSNCGEILYCRDPQFHRPEYKCFKGSGCTNAQIQSDLVSDCDYVCGSSACRSIDLTNCPF